MLAQRAELPGLLTAVHGDLLEAMIQDPHHLTVEADPHLAAQVLRRRRVERTLDFDVAVAADAPLPFLIERKAFLRQRSQRGALHTLEQLPDMLFRRAVNPRIGDG